MPSDLPSPPEAHPGATRRLDVSEALVGERLDKALALALPDLSRSRLHALVEAGAVLLNEAPAKASAKLRLGDRVSVSIPAPTTSTLEPEKADLRILFEDEALLVVSKPAGMVVHPGAGVARGTLAAALLAHCGALSQIGGVTRPGIVHRLDKGTSGLLVVAKDDAAHRALSAQFKGRTVTKIYSAICLGAPRASRGSITGSIGRDPRERKRMAVSEAGRVARTDYEVIERLGIASVVRLTLHTGRTHQIRVHLASARCPLVGDALYGAAGLAGRLSEPARRVVSAFSRPALHAEVLGFEHPRTGESLRFEEPWPDDLVDLRAQLRSLSGPKKESHT